MQLGNINSTIELSGNASLLSWGLALGQSLLAILNCTNNQIVLWIQANSNRDLTLHPWAHLNIELCLWVTFVVSMWANTNTIPWHAFFLHKSLMGVWMRCHCSTVSNLQLTIFKICQLFFLLIRWIRLTGPRKPLSWLCSVPIYLIRVCFELRQNETLTVWLVRTLCCMFDSSIPLENIKFLDSA